MCTQKASSRRHDPLGVACRSTVEPSTCWSTSGSISSSSAEAVTRRCACCSSGSGMRFGAERPHANTANLVNALALYPRVCAKHARQFVTERSCYNTAAAMRPAGLLLHVCSAVRLVAQPRRSNPCRSQVTSLAHAHEFASSCGDASHVAGKSSMKVLFCGEQLFYSFVYTAEALEKDDGIEVPLSIKFRPARPSPLVHVTASTGCQMSRIRGKRPNSGR